MKKIFVDANILVDFLDKSARDHQTAVECLLIIRKHFGKPIVSPASFIIINYLLQKTVRNKQWHRKQMQLVVSQLEFTHDLSGYIEEALQSKFIDLEDGLQYQCALSVKASAILTKDLHDYHASNIAVIHPFDFVNRYKQL